MRRGRATSCETRWRSRLNCSKAIDVGGRPASSSHQIINGSAMMSRTVRRGLRAEIGSWKIICRTGLVRRRVSSSSVVNSVPSRLTEPEVGRGTCIMALPVVDFPHPDSPTRPSVSPSTRSIEIPDTACTTWPVVPTGNSTVRSSAGAGVSDSDRRWALPLPATTAPTPGARSAPAAVADEVEGQDGEEHHRGRHQADVGGGLQVGPAFVDHVAPCRGRRGDRQPEEGHRPLDHDQVGHHDEGVADQGRGHVGEDLAET